MRISETKLRERGVDGYGVCCNESPFVFLFAFVASTRFAVWAIKYTRSSLNYNQNENQCPLSVTLLPQVKQCKIDRLLWTRQLMLYKEQCVHCKTG